MGWPEVGQSTGGDFLKIDAGQKVKLHVLSEEPYSFKQHFFDIIQRSAVCPGADAGCPECAQGGKGHEARTQHAFHVVDEEGNTKVWMMGNRLAEQVKNIYDTYGGFETIDLIVTRQGVQKQTKYQVTPVPSKIDFSQVDVSTLPNLEETYVPASIEDIESMMNGVDPGTQYPPPEEGGAEEAPEKPKPQARTNGGTDPKLAVIKDIMKMLATNPKYKNPQARVMVFKRCAPGKTTVGTMSLPELVRVRNELKK